MVIKPKIHKLSEIGEGFGRYGFKYRECDPRDKDKVLANCGANVTFGNRSKRWKDVTCKNCLRDMVIDSDTLISDIPPVLLSFRARASILHREIKTLGDLIQRKTSDIKSREYCGATTIEEIQRFLEEARLPRMDEGS